MEQAPMCWTEVDASTARDFRIRRAMGMTVVVADGRRGILVSCNEASALVEFDGKRWEAFKVTNVGTESFKLESY